MDWTGIGTTGSGTSNRVLSRAEIEAIRVRHPIEGVIARYTELRKSGRTLKGHCPLPGHADRNPSFTVYVEDQRFYCFGCDRAGDVFDFLEMAENFNFRAAIDKLEAGYVPPKDPRPYRSRHVPTGSPANAGRAAELNPSQTALLTAVTTLYHVALLTNPEMMDYIRGRGISTELIKRFRLGYATGEDLVKYFEFRGWDLEQARPLGLLGDHGEFFEKRIVIPELRDGQVVFIIGRKTLDSQEVKYLGLPGAPKPLYGGELIKNSREVFIVEGPFDWLTLIDWGYPAVALLGSHMKAEWAAELAHADRLFIVTDADEAGRHSAERLAATFGDKAIVVPPLPDANDVNELAQNPDGAALFAEWVARAGLDRHKPHAHLSAHYANVRG